MPFLNKNTRVYGSMVDPFLKSFMGLFSLKSYMGYILKSKIVLSTIWGPFRIVGLKQLPHWAPPRAGGE